MFWNAISRTITSLTQRCCMQKYAGTVLNLFTKKVTKIEDKYVVKVSDFGMKVEFI